MAKPVNLLSLCPFSRPASLLRYNGLAHCSLAAWECSSPGKKSRQTDTGCWDQLAERKTKIEERQQQHKKEKNEKNEKVLESRIEKDCAKKYIISAQDLEIPRPLPAYQRTDLSAY